MSPTRIHCDSESDNSVSLLFHQERSGQSAELRLEVDSLRYSTARSSISGTRRNPSHTTKTINWKLCSVFGGLLKVSWIANSNHPRKQSIHLSTRSNWNVRMKIWKNFVCCAGVILLQDNPKLRATKVTRYSFIRVGWEALMHPHTPLTLQLQDIIFISFLDNHLRGRLLRTLYEVIHRHLVALTFRWVLTLWDP